MTELPVNLQALAWALVHFLWQGALIASGLAVVRKLTPTARSEYRYALTCTALVFMALTPVVGFFWMRAEILSRGLPLTFAATFETPSAPSRLEAAAMPWLLLAWAVGVLCMSGRWIAGWIRVRGLRRDARPIEGQLGRRLERLVAEVARRSSVRVLASARVAVPILAGCFKPVILIPLSAISGLPAPYLEAAILHELAHLRRFDPWVNQLQLLIDTLLFYHPGVWWVSRIICIEREHCCDEVVVALTGDRLGYARALTQLETLRADFSQQALASNGGSLMSRIQRIVQPRESGHSRSVFSAWLLAAGTAVLAVTVVTTGLVVTTGVVAKDSSAQTIAWLPESVEQWRVHIDEAAQRHSVDADLLAIMILVESAGNPVAESSGGALGLMQVMPRTGAAIAEARGIEDFEIEQLRDPARNIDFGAWYMAGQMAKFGDVELAAAAYNGGPKRVRQMLEKKAELSEETERYRTLVKSLWLERTDANSETYDGWLERGGRGLLVRAEATH